MKIKGLKKVKYIDEKVKASNGKMYATGEKIALFRCPDGYKTTYDGFIKEAERGRLHGCIIASS